MVRRRKIEEDQFNGKVTWRIIYQDFKRRHPNLSKKAVRFEPHDYATILIYLDDGLRLIYNYDEHKAVILSVNWK